MFLSKIGTSMCGKRSRQDRQMRDDVVKTAEVSTVFAQTRAVAADDNVHNTEQVIALILVDSQTNFTGSHSSEVTD